MADRNHWEGVFTRFKPASSVWEIRKVQRGLRYAGLYVLFAGVTYFYTNISTRAGVPRINQTYSSYPAGTDILFDATEVLAYTTRVWYLIGKTSWLFYVVANSFLPFLFIVFELNNANLLDSYKWNFVSKQLYKSAIGNIFEEEDWGPLEYAIMAKHFDRQGKTPYMYHSQYMTHLLSNGQLKGPF